MGKNHIPEIRQNVFNCEPLKIVIPRMEKGDSISPDSVHAELYRRRIILLMEPYAASLAAHHFVSDKAEKVFTDMEQMICAGCRRYVNVTQIAEILMAPFGNKYYPICVDTFMAESKCWAKFQLGVTKAAGFEGFVPEHMDIEKTYAKILKEHKFKG